MEHTTANRHRVQTALQRHGKKRKEHSRAGEKLDREFMALLGDARSLAPFPLSSYEISELAGIPATTVKRRIQELDEKDSDND